MSGNVFAGGITVSVKPGTTTVPALLLTSQLVNEVLDDNTTGAVFTITGVAGQTIRVFRMILNVSAATAIEFLSDATPLMGEVAFGTNGGMVLDFSGDPWFETAAGEDFIISQTGSANVAGVVGYVQS